mgnify:CR=1 FL=1
MMMGRSDPLLPLEAAERLYKLVEKPTTNLILFDSGHRLRVYVPFGEHWYAYSTRRLKENPNVAGMIVKALFRRS